MSRKEEFLAKADKCLALADHAGHWSTVETLKQAASSWQMLAQMEDQHPGPPTRWQVVVGGLLGADRP